MQEIGRPFAGPPGIPADRMKILRDAFEKAAKNPEYQAKAKKIGLTLVWHDYKELGQIMKSINDDVQNLISALQ